MAAHRPQAQLHPGRRHPPAHGAHPDTHRPGRAGLPAQRRRPPPVQDPARVGGPAELLRGARGEEEAEVEGDIDCLQADSRGRRGHRDELAEVLPARAGPVRVLGLAYPQADGRLRLQRRAVRLPQVRQLPHMEMMPGVYINFSTSR